jgi:hypothetical protein
VKVSILRSLHQSACSNCLLLLERDYGPGSPMNGTGSRMVFASPAPVPGWDAAYSVAGYRNGIGMNE